MGRLHQKLRHEIIEDKDEDQGGDDRPGDGCADFARAPARVEPDVAAHEDDHEPEHLRLRHSVHDVLELRVVPQRREIRLIYSLQTEEERGEGGFALPLDIENSSNITVANFHMYRVVSSFQPFPYAIRIAASKDIRLRNIHCYSDSKVSFDSAVYDQTSKIEVRQREFAWLRSEERRVGKECRSRWSPH